MPMMQEMMNRQWYLADISSRCMQANLSVWMSHEQWHHQQHSQYSQWSPNYGVLLLLFTLSLWFFIIPAECFFKSLTSFWHQLLLNAHGRPFAWIWAWCVEGNTDTSHSHFICKRRRCCWINEHKVSHYYSNVLLFIWWFTGTAKSHHLGRQPFMHSIQMYLWWNNSQHITSKIFYR